MQCSLPVQGEHVCSGIRAQQVSHARNIIEQRGAPERRDAIIVQRITAQHVTRVDPRARIKQLADFCGIRALKREMQLLLDRPRRRSSLRHGVAAQSAHQQHQRARAQSPQWPAMTLTLLGSAAGQRGA